MKIVIIGTGNVATVLGKKLKLAGHSIQQVAGRNIEAAKQLGLALKAAYTDDLTVINPNAEIYLIAVSDSAISNIAGNLKLPGKVVAHTAAAVSIDVLNTVSENFGSFYPLQSLNKESQKLPDIPMFFDGSSADTIEILKQLAGSISSFPPLQASDDVRLKLHIAAVFTNNFTNYMYMLADEYCKKENLDFQLLLPLIKETAERINDNTPASVQTGPAIRNDLSTIEKHLALLSAYSHLGEVYSFLSKQISAKR